MTTQSKPTLQLNVTIEEANLILESLGDKPFVKVHTLINKIQNQAQSQLSNEVMNNGSASDVDESTISTPVAKESA